jgi:hypothetical protein
MEIIDANLKKNEMFFLKKVVFLWVFSIKIIDANLIHLLDLTRNSCKKYNCTSSGRYPRASIYPKKGGGDGLQTMKVQRYATRNFF